MILNNWRISLRASVIAVSNVARLSSVSSSVAIASCRANHSSNVRAARASPATAFFNAGQQSIGKAGDCRRDYDRPPSFRGFDDCRDVRKALASATDVPPNLITVGRMVARE